MSVYESELNLNPSFMPTANVAEREHGYNQRLNNYERNGQSDQAIHRRRRWTQEEKRSIVGETEADGASISGVARKYGIAPRLLFSWRRQLSDEMALTTRSGAKIVPISLVHDLEKRIRDLEAQLERKTSELGELMASMDDARPNASGVGH